MVKALFLKLENGIPSHDTLGRSLFGLLLCTNITMTVSDMYLLDTNVVADLRKPRPHDAVVAWIEGIADADLFLSAVTLGEIQADIEPGKSSWTQRRKGAKLKTLKISPLQPITRWVSRRVNATLGFLCVFASKEL